MLDWKYFWHIPLDKWGVWKFAGILIAIVAIILGGVTLTSKYYFEYKTNVIIQQNNIEELNLNKQK